MLVDVRIMLVDLDRELQKVPAGACAMRCSVLRTRTASADARGSVRFPRLPYLYAMSGTILPNGACLLVRYAMSGTGIRTLYLPTQAQYAKFGTGMGVVLVWEWDTPCCSREERRGARMRTRSGTR
eukprot:3265332-Rhodomonas_salina.1